MNHSITRQRNRVATGTSRLSLFAASLATIMLLSACATRSAQDTQTALVDYNQLSEMWAELPVEQNGQLPTISDERKRLTADYHIVVYLNPSTLPPPARWCDATVAFKEITAPITELQVAAALCHQGEVVTTAQERVPLDRTTPEQRRQEVASVERLLLDQLDPDPKHSPYGG